MARKAVEQQQEPAAEWVPIEKLLPWVKNPRKNEPAVAPVAESIRTFGFGAPIVARRQNFEVIAGHTRLKAAKVLGLKTVPVRFMDLTDDEAHKLAIADNKLNELADWDKLGLAGLLGDMSKEDATLLGFDEDELAKLLEGSGAVNGDDDDPLDLPSKPVSKPGEVYELGPHRLLCGDSTSPDSWSRVLKPDERLHIVWTDPPYGVDYVGKTKEALKIQNDALNEEQLLTLLRSSLGAALASCAPGAAWYVAAPAGPLFHTFGTVLKELGVWRHTLTWLKDVFVMGRCDYHYKHEPLFYGWEPNGRHYWCGARDLHTILDFERPKRSTEHPTMKPPELIQFCLRNSSKTGQLVGDPFGGSGSTMIAAAREGRVSRLIELDPRYCDVIRRRWGRFAETGGVEPGRGALAAA